VRHPDDAEKATRLKRAAIEATDMLPWRWDCAKAPDTHPLRADTQQPGLGAQKVLGIVPPGRAAARKGVDLRMETAYLVGVPLQMAVQIQQFGFAARPADTRSAAWGMIVLSLGRHQGCPSRVKAGQCVPTVLSGHIRASLTRSLRWTVPYRRTSS
jgi:hypothetical protein